MITRRRLFTAVAILCIAGCVTESQESTGSRYRFFVEGEGGQLQEAAPLRGADEARGPRSVETAAGRAPGQEFQSLDPGGAQLQEPAAGSPFHRFDWNLIRNPDGTLTKIYYFRTDPGVEVYLDLMKRFVPGFAELQEGQDFWFKPDYVLDPRRRNDDVWHEGSDIGLSYGTGPVADLLMVTATEEVLRQVDSFLDGALSEVPQIELEVTIVEISLDDGFQWGIQYSATRGTADDPESGLIDNVVVDLAQDLVNGTFGSFSAIQDELVVNGLVEFLQTTTSSNVLSSPKLAVLNGYRAVIDTGSETPFYTPTFNAVGLTGITTQFKPTGIRVVVVPFILSPDVVQLELNIEVSAVTGFVTAGIGNDAEVENPLISRRNAYTIVNVPSGRSVLIGGLVITNDVDSEDKVPFLGDIPLLGYLFKRSTVTKQRAQVLFLVQPRIIYDRFQAGVLYDPGVEYQEWAGEVVER